ncbi:zinc finger BED domain-containing protein 5-like [Acyrthosiphon pisum]|uniref:Zinc finger BED domain-containing protein 5 n=1 Tax=Acyrthosiphon pisum TaxID=7029 RepID=A0A8R2B5Y3_ACYPI|nr:zinc finger BED domain-containing protein 5-like [Acyrthosiphon pisum]|eukprot:XP_008183154.1 PREDICTED: zinc finger BED domain-containing protein 5-like [Acyrthosiphon pisum]
MTEIVRCMIGEEAAKKIATVQCSNNTISDRIHKISDHIEDQLIKRLKSCKLFAIKLDKSTDVAGLSILLVFVRYIFETSIEEDLLLCTPLDTNTTGEEIFKVIDSYMNKHQVDWVKCIDVCSDGAAAMVGKIKGTVTRIKNVAPKCHSSYCVLHRHALVSKKMPLELKQVLNEAVCIVNYIKSRPLQSRLFKKVCEEIGSQHYSVLLHTEIRWLSREKYFPATNNDVDWIQNPFMNQKKPAMLSMLEYEQLIEIKSMSYLKQKFESGSLNEFWIELKDEYPSLVEKTIFTLLPFVTTIVRLVFPLMRIQKINTEID